MQKIFQQLKYWASGNDVVTSAECVNIHADGQHLWRRWGRWERTPLMCPEQLPWWRGPGCWLGDRCSRLGTALPTFRQPPSPSLLQEWRAVQSGLPGRHCAPSSNTLKPEERHLFKLGLNLAPRLPEDWRTCCVGFWPDLCRLDL